MTNEFKYLMDIFACGARGELPEPPHEDVDWERVRQLSQNQTITATVACALKQLPSDIIPQDLLTTSINSIRSTAVYNIQRTVLVLKLLKEFEQANISVVVLKGFAVAQFYAVPECRISADTDILISSKDELRAYALLHKNGFDVQPRSPKTHHAVCEHPQIGTIELHTMLYDEIVEDVWFDKLDEQKMILEPYEKLSVLEGDYYSLGKTDNLIFLALHMIKHFIISGTSLRMMMDTALFFKTNMDEIDSERFWRILSELKFGEMMSTLLGAMITYCGFTKKDFPGIGAYSEEKVLTVLDDLETGGWLGFNDKKAREDGWHEFNRKKLIQRSGVIRYKLYMHKWSANSYWHALFPSREHLAKRYPYACKSMLLVPVAWLHRIFTRGVKYLFCHEKTRYIVRDESNITMSGSKRVEIFRELGMI